MWIKLPFSKSRLFWGILPVPLGLAVFLGILTFGADGAVRVSNAPADSKYVNMGAAVPVQRPAAGPDASTGSYTVDCGRNEQGHYNMDNVVISPGVVNGAHHTHDYVGNLSTDALSTDRSLAAAGTTCAGGDRSTYYWPVLRRLDRTGEGHQAGPGAHGNTGEAVTASSVRVEFRGNPVSSVVGMPRFLRLITGDPVAATTESSNVRAQWGCSGYPDRFARNYVRCPQGSGPTRTLDFPSCWNGLATDSRDHRTHAEFPAADGACPRSTFPVPQLRITLTYSLPAGTPFAVDSFPEQQRDPVTDHAIFVNVMTEDRMAALVRCINGGRHCESGPP
ncbi:DUF1996 domain-containing protein [Streptomyces sp. C11-1]|uniref:DUF1996 domain-containing protein n=1 Tax=Streptomyces durocortorensis TaxID=2811104 RepID=A0ABY9W3F9_9ACTN|nr:DUF1996 domain-containing protein [Streptomyces durocortorensis]WNF30694.1 DUF1996 domain-containing protein [Streptomyces durocortorensis]